MPRAPCVRPGSSLSPDPAPTVTDTSTTVASTPSDHPVPNGTATPQAGLNPSGVDKPSRAEAEQAVRTLLAWAGDDPNREGLLDTPKRVVKAYEEWFQGYDQDPDAELGRTFGETEGYDEMVTLRNMRVQSHCEHHIAPIIGVAHVAYLPNKRVVGLSKIARIVDIFGRRLQIQEKMTVQIADALEKALKPRGVAVVIAADHQCMTTRGVHHERVDTVTSHMTGVFRSDEATRREFLSLIHNTK